MKTSKYKYSTFNEMTYPEEYNFYGIIYDASFPMLDEHNDGNQTANNQNSNANGGNQPRYECTIKLIDQEVNLLTNPMDFNDKIINLIIKSNNKDAMPYIHSIGDIIRVHFGKYSHKKKRNVYVHLSNTKNFKSSWCIFAGASDIESKDTTPILCSHNNYTFESQDTQIIQFLRGWIKQNLAMKNSIMYPLESKLIKRQNRDEDAIVQVVYKTELEDQMVYYVQDETDGCELHTFKYFNFIDVNDVIRLRGYRIIDKNVIIMHQFSNILKIPPFTDYYKEFILRMEEKLNNAENKDVQMQSFTFDDNDQDQEIIKGVKPEIRLIETPKTIVVKLKDDENEGLEVKRYDDISPYEHRFIIDVKVVDISPKTLTDCLNILCDNCHSTYPMNSIKMNLIRKFHCSACKKEVNGIIHYNMVLHCIENMYSNKILILHLCTYDNIGEENIFGIAAYDCYNSEQTIEALNQKIKHLLNKDSYIRVKCEAYQTGDKEGHYIYRIIGEYNQI